MRQSPVRRRRLVAATAAATCLVILSTLGNPAPSAVAAQTQAFPTRLLHPDAPYYQKLPRTTPVASDSQALVGDLVRQAETYYGSPGNPTIDVNYHRFGPTMYVTRNSDPLVNFGTENCQGKGPGWDTELKANHLSRIRIPSHAQPDNSSDGSMVLYNTDTDELTETWVTKKHANGTWTACWGGTLRNASKSVTGAFTVPYGTSASGLPLAATIMRAEELRNRRIDHVINLGIPHVKAWPATTWPATRTDGGTQGRAFTMGQMLRLPADLNIDALNLSPSARTIAKAAQEYGIMITESSGSVTFGAQNPASLQSDPYPEIFRGRWAIQEMLGDPARGEGRFPLDKLQVLPLGYRVPAGGGNPTTPPSPTPTQTTKPTQTPSTSPTPKPTPTSTSSPTASPSPTAAPGQVVRRLDAGAGRSDGWSSGDGFVGGWPYAVSRPIDLSGASTPAPTRIYQSEHAAMSQHLTSGLQAGRRYKVRLHFAELYWTHPGSRIFNVSANGSPILNNFDIVAAAGDPAKAVIRESTVTADPQGRIRLDFTRVRDQASIAGIEILTA